MQQEILETSPTQELISSKHFCIMPWVHCHVTTAGNVNACTMSSVQLGTVRDNTLHEVWQGKNAREFRQAHLSGEPVKGCEGCYNLERGAKKSLRQFANKFYASNVTDLAEGKMGKDGTPLPPPIDYDIRFSNICNLKCRSCSHFASSRWFEDNKAVYGFTAGPLPVLRAFESAQHFDRFLGDFVDHIEKITFAGGEPLLSDEHQMVLHALHTRGRRDVAIFYHTNFTALDHRGVSVTNYWRDFRNLLVAASLDGSGERGEVLRNGLSWKKVLENRERLRRECPNVDFRVTCSVSALNIWHVPDFHRELIETGFIAPGEFDLIIVQTPDHMSSQVLPSALKLKIEHKISDHTTWLRKCSPSAEEVVETIDEFKAVSRFMLEQDHSNLLPDLLRFCRKLDGLRKENSQKVFPELAHLWRLGF